MNDVGKKEAAEDLGSKLIATVEKQAKDPTWVTNIKIEEHKINPINITFNVLLTKDFDISFDQATDLEGNPKEGSEAVHVTKPDQKAKVEAILQETLKDEVFVIHMEPIKGRLHKDQKLLERASQLLDEDECKGLEALDYETLAVRERAFRHHQKADELFAKSKSLGINPRSPELVEKRYRRIEGVIDRILEEQPQWRP